MGLLRRLVTLALLGAAMTASLGMPGLAGAAEGEKVTITVAIRCPDDLQRYWPARPGRPRVLSGDGWGRGWFYEWTCVTLRDGAGNERSYAWVEFDQWGGVALDLNIVSPNPTTVLLADRGRRVAPAPNAPVRIERGPALAAETRVVGNP